MAYIGQREDEWEAEQKKLEAKKKSQVKKQRNKNLRFRCPVPTCNQRFSSLTKYKNHITNVHGLSDEKLKAHLSALAQKKALKQTPWIRVYQIGDVKVRVDLREGIWLDPCGDGKHDVISAETNKPLFRVDAAQAKMIWDDIDTYIQG